MRWVFSVLVIVEIAALALALRLVPSVSFANEAVLIVAVNGVLLVFVAKRLKKKKDCCS
jgi:hypothetical protein